MRKVAALSVVFALLTSGAALAGRGDPQKRFTEADQARAKAMLLRKADLGLGLTGTRPASTGETDFYCRALDASDLVLTGEMQSPEFQFGPSFVWSAAEVYRTVADSNAAWRRGTSAAGVACAASEFRRLARTGGMRFLSLRQIVFPRVAPRTAAYRVAFLVPTQSGNLRLAIDLIALQHGRAQTALYLGTAIGEPQQDLEVDLARTISRRMAKATRGA